MLGAIIGDIAGSSYEVLEFSAIKNNLDKKRSYEERIKILDKNTPLFNEEDSYTDDSVLTTAIATALLNDKNYEYYLRKYGNLELNLGVDKYGRSRFGRGFTNWLKHIEQGNGYGNSYGNGACMRISPVAYYFDDINEMRKNVKLATIPSHNSFEAIKYAYVVSDTIFLARHNYSKDEIKKHLKAYYNVDFNYNLEDLQKNYTFKSNCMHSVPQAIYCFLESTDFEDSIRKSLSIGGDSDTIACIVGSISEAYYGIPQNIIDEVDKYIPQYIKDVINKFYSNINNKSMKEEKQYGKQFKRNYKNINK